MIFNQIHFISSFTEVYIFIFKILSDATRKIIFTIQWIHQEKDDNMAEFGEDLQNASFKLVANDLEHSP